VSGSFWFYLSRPSRRRFPSLRHSRRRHRFRPPLTPDQTCRPRYLASPAKRASRRRQWRGHRSGHHPRRHRNPRLLERSISCRSACRAVGPIHAVAALDRAHQPIQRPVRPLRRSSPRALVRPCRMRRRARRPLPSHRRPSRGPASTIRHHGQAACSSGRCVEPSCRISVPSRAACRMTA